MTEKEYMKKMKKGDITFRSCWKCNPAHGHLKKVDWIVVCFVCGRAYYKGKLLKIEKEDKK